jgi:predicted enzyme related to lactoylglutathione lyase
MTERVTGIGGIFFKAKDPESLRAWYRDHLGIELQPWGGAVFPWTDATGVTVWSIHPEDDASFAPSTAPFRINYRVADLHALLGQLRAKGCTVLDQVDESELGLFGWVIDPEGNKVELWQPPSGG